MRFSGRKEAFFGSFDVVVPLKNDTSSGVQYERFCCGSRSGCQLQQQGRKGFGVALTFNTIDCVFNNAYG